MMEWRKEEKKYCTRLQSSLAHYTKLDKNKIFKMQKKRDQQRRRNIVMGFDWTKKQKKKPHHHHQHQCTEM